MTDKATAVRVALSSYLEPYINPMIVGPTPEEDKRELLVTMARAYLETFDDPPDRVLLSMGEWTVEVSP